MYSTYDLRTSRFRRVLTRAGVRISILLFPRGPTLKISCQSFVFGCATCNVKNIDYLYYDVMSHDYLEYIIFHPFAIP